LQHIIVSITMVGIAIYIDCSSRFRRAVQKYILLQ
jgi:hypothetical protein